MRKELAKSQQLLLVQHQTSDKLVSKFLQAVPSKACKAGCKLFTQCLNLEISCSHSTF